MENGKGINKTKVYTHLKNEGVLGVTEQIQYIHGKASEATAHWI